MDGRRSLSQLELESRPTYLIYKNILDTVVKCNALFGVPTSRFFTSKSYSEINKKLTPLQETLQNLLALITPFEESRLACSDLLDKYKKTEQAQDDVNELTRKLSQLEVDKDNIQDQLEEESRQLNAEVLRAQSEVRTTRVIQVTEEIINTDTLERQIADLRSEARELEKKIQAHCCGIKQCNKAEYAQLDGIQADLQSKLIEKRKIYEEHERKKAEAKAKAAAAESQDAAIEHEKTTKIGKLQIKIEEVNQRIRDHIQYFPQKILTAQQERDKRQVKFDRQRLEQDNYEIEFNCAINIPLLLGFLQCNIFWNAFRATVDAQVTYLQLHPQEDTYKELGRFEAMAKRIKQSESKLDIQGCLDHLWCYESQDHRLAYFYGQFTELTQPIQTWLKNPKLLSEQLLTATLQAPAVDILAPKQPGARLDLLKTHAGIIIDSAPVTLIQMLRAKEEQVALDLIQLCREDRASAPTRRTIAS